MLSANKYLFAGGMIFLIVIASRYGSPKNPEGCCKRGLEIAFVLNACKKCQALKINPEKIVEDRNA